MIEVSKASLMIIRTDDTVRPDALEIITDSETFCPSIIGLKNPNESVFDDCNYNCKECWDKALKDVDDFKILWKHKGSDEYV